MSLLNKMQQYNKYHTVDISKLTTKRIIGKVNLMENINSKAEDFINIVFYQSNMYILSFIGVTCIVKRIPIKIEGDSEPFEITVNASTLKVLSNKEYLTLDVVDNKLIWTFQYGDGVMKRTMQPTSWRDNLGFYMDFVLNLEPSKSEGSIKSDDLKFLNKIAKGVIRDEKSRNIIVKEGYMFVLSPSFVIYKKTESESEMLITEVVLSCLPRVASELDCYTKNGLQGLVSKDKSIFYIFKNMTTRSKIKPYIDNPIEWIGELPNKIEDAINVVSFGEVKPINIEFNKGTVRVYDSENQDNMYLSETYAYHDRVIEISSIVMNFRDMAKLGKMNTPKTILNVIQFRGGEICLLN